MGRLLIILLVGCATSSNGYRINAAHGKFFADNPCGPVTQIILEKILRNGVIMADKEQMVVTYQEGRIVSDGVYGDAEASYGFFTYDQDKQVVIRLARADDKTQARVSILEQDLNCHEDWIGDVR